MPRKAGRGGLSRHGEKGCLVVCTLAFLAVFLFAVFLFAKDADGKQVCDWSSDLDGHHWKTEGRFQDHIPAIPG